MFETGYGPSGLPHIGTFGEVARTSWVRQAFETLSGLPTRLIAFSDDMDGLRKVPDNVPNQVMLREHLGKPLTAIPDPFGTHESFGAHNNARLKAFLDRFGFRYEFLSSTDCYKSGRFDQALLAVLEHYEEVRDVVLPTLGPDRRATYSPFLPVSPLNGRVLQAPILEWNRRAGTIVYEEEGRRTELPVTGGHCKLQWKADWAMRWVGFGCHREMSGKGIIPYVKPRAAKRLYFDVIPKAVDDYLAFVAQYHRGNEKPEAKFENPVWFIRGGNPPEEDYPVSFALLLNLVSASGASDRDVLWGFIRAYAPDATPQTHPGLDRLVTYALKYYEGFVKPQKRYRAATGKEREALSALADALESMNGERDSEKVQTLVYEIGKTHAFEPLRDWFKAIYEVALGQTQGPRFGSFAALFGCAETAVLIRTALSGAFVAGAEG